MKATLESLHATCATCHGRRTFVRACPFCADSGHDHECDDTHVPCVAEVHLLADQLGADVEDAAKYRAAVERIDEAVERMPSIASGQVREVLEWMLEFDGMPVPATLDKARVAEVLRDSRDRHLKAAQERAGSSLEMDHRAMADACTQVATRLGLTLDTPPSGPGGGEDWPLPPHDRCDLTCVMGRPKECAGPEMSGIRAATRARIAPTPTPEVPPLKDETLDEYRARTAVTALWKWRDDEGNAANVSAEGYHLHGDVEVIAGALARALAEAKREVEKSNQRVKDEAAKLGPALDLIRDALRPYGCTFPGGGLIGITAGIDEVVRKAAESMRERAAQACDETANDTAAPNSIREVARLLARLIRALPLE